MEATFSLPARPLEELFPGIEALEVGFPATQIVRRRDMVLPLAELLALAAICRHIRPKRIFEIGTYTGSSTLVMALNTPADAEIHTLDLDASDRAIGSAFRGRPVTSKIRQHFGSSMRFDYSSFRGTVDLVFVDANHTYDFVKSDSNHAFGLLRSGGVILWDDYVWDPDYPECRGVAEYLRELSTMKPCYRIAGTRFAIYIGGVKRS